MGDFEKAHRTASTQERDCCQVDVMELQCLDENLKEQSEYLLEMVAEEFREQLGLPTHGVQATGADSLQAILDRKA